MIGTEGASYFAQEVCRQFSYTEDDFTRRDANDCFRRLMAAEVDRAAGYLHAGLPLVDMMPRGLRGDVWLFAQGGLAILERIRHMNYDVWRGRPKISRAGKLRLLCGAWWRNASGGPAQRHLARPA